MVEALLGEGRLLNSIVSTNLLGQFRSSYITIDDHDDDENDNEINGEDAARDNEDIANDDDAPQQPRVNNPTWPTICPLT